MAELAVKPMSVDEFLRWDDGTDTHYELIGGFPVAMAPPAEAHSMLAVQLVARLNATLALRRPCRVLFEAGVIRPDRADTYFVADLAATCAPGERRRQAIAEPFLIIEIMSPSTERHDRLVKLPAYRQIPSVQEILYIDSDAISAELHRRSGVQWITDLLRGTDAVLSLASVPLEMPLGDLYEGIALSDELVDRF